MTERLIPYLEWESPRAEIEIVDRGPLRIGFERVLVSRNSEYGLVAHLEGKDDRATREGPTLKAGEMIEGGVVTGKLENGQVVRLTEVVEGDLTINGLGEMKGEAIIQCAEVASQPDVESQWVSVWLLNGPENLIFPRGTSRDDERKISRVRNGGAAPGASVERKVGGEGSSRDFFNLNCPTLSGRFCRVPKEFGPDWSQNCALEIISSPTGSGVPQEIPRDIFTALSFALGRQLTPIGATWFDGEGYPTKVQWQRPWGWDLKRRCAIPDMPPVKLQDRVNFLEAEGSISGLLEAFSSKATVLKLYDASWHYWLGSFSPPDTAIGHLATALETIMQAWFRSNLTKSGGLYLPVAEFEGHTVGPLADIEKSLGSVPNADRIMRRLRGANRFGVNESFERFFSELGLPVGSVEEYVIGARNRFVHGGGAIGSKGYPALAAAWRAYQTLVNRVILRAIGHAGSYIDYSTYGFPERPLDRPLGGPDGSGNPLKLP